MDLLLAIIGHLVGDYLLQNDWMALNKKAQFWPCLVHCTLWSLSVILFAGWLSFSIFLLLIGTHVIQDHTFIIRRWMKWVGQEQFATGPCAPWSIIVVDNVWHIVTLCAIWKFWIHQ